jgi:acetyl esterase
MEFMSDALDAPDAPSIGGGPSPARPVGAGANGSTGRVTKRAAATSTARKRAPARAAAPKSATSPAPAPSAATEEGIAAGGPVRGSGRGGMLYNRRIQRMNERWPLATRCAARFLSKPDLLLGVLGKRSPVVVDGRMLNRSVQAMLELTSHVPGASDGAPDATGSYDPVVMRAQLRRSSMIAMPGRTDVYVSGRVIPGPEGAPAIPVRVYRRFGAAVRTARGVRVRPPAIVYYHGGGWVTGDLDSHDGVCRLLAAVSRCTVVAVDYRLAPEDPFPAAIDDAVAAYQWVHRHAEELGIAEGRVGVMGDSAGGNLAAAVAQLTRAGAGSLDDVPPPVAQGLIYPAVDARLDTPSMHTLSSGFFLTRASMEYFRGAYLPNREDWETAKASPLLAEDHRGLAPALVVTAGFDPLRDDGVNYAEALRKAGVEVEYRCYDDQIHGFVSMGILADSLALATEVCDAMGQWMRRTTATEAAT